LGRLLGFLSVFVLALAPGLAEACPTCGQAFNFSPKLLFISTAFFFLPILIVAIIGWKVWKGERNHSKE
jgi:hypothetical protein